MTEFVEFLATIGLDLNLMDSIPSADWPHLGGALLFLWKVMLRI